MATVTRINVKYDVLNLLNPRMSEVLRTLVMPLTASAAGSTTTLKDALLGRGTHAVDDFNGIQIENVTKGEAYGVIDAGFVAATGQLTFAPTSTATEENDVYALYANGLSPEMFDQEIDRVLLATFAPHLYFPSMVPGAEMTGTVATEWPDDGSGSITQTYDTADGYTFFGETSLKVITDTVDEGVKSETINVTEGETLLVSCMVACPTGSLQVRLYDETNSAEIKASGTYDDPVFNEIRFTATVPDNCEQVTLRFTVKTAISTFYVAPPTVLQSQSGHLYHLPSWFTRESQYKKAVTLPLGMSGEADLSYIAMARQFAPGPAVEFIVNHRAINPFSVTFRAPSRPVALVVERPFDALASNTATTTCLREYLKWKVAANICRKLGDDEWRNYASPALRIARSEGYGEKVTKGKENVPAVLSRSN